MTESKLVDRGESTGLMEPLLIAAQSRRRATLSDMTLELGMKSSALRSAMQPSMARSLADLVRAMNCYYSNLIEGHDTHPVDIERALRAEFSTNPRNRDLQIEARAHIAVQKWIDDGGLVGRAFTREGLSDIHRRFCENLPASMLEVASADGDRKVPLVPGALRTVDVQVGRHVPISAGAVPRFLDRFEAACRALGKVDAILAAATSHHRLLWIHPFADGNGRVARLMSHAVLCEQLGSGALWSVARGLARRVEDYKRHLADCDQPRRGDRDGRGHLTEEGLEAFTVFFIEVAIDQVDFMTSLVQPERLRLRVMQWAEEEVRAGGLPPRARDLLNIFLYRGQLARSEIAGLMDVSDRQARRLVEALSRFGVVRAEGPRGPIELAFPAALAERWMPGLFPPLPPRQP